MSTSCGADPQFICICGFWLVGQYVHTYGKPGFMKYFGRNEDSGFDEGRGRLSSSLLEDTDDEEVEFQPLRPELRDAINAADEWLSEDDSRQHAPMRAIGPRTLPDYGSPLGRIQYPI